MKHIYIYSIAQVGRRLLPTLVLLAVLLAGCSKTLDLMPLNSFSDKSVFSDAATMRFFVNDTYAFLRHPFDNQGGLTEGMTDNAYAKYVNGQKAYTAGELTRDNGESMTRELWEDAYDAIRRTNLFLEQAANSPLDATVLAGLRAEMRFIRAFKYLELMKFYGGVPVITTTFQLNSESFDVARNTIEEVTDFIVKECNEIITVLPDFATAEKGRANKEAAMALKGRTLLYAASPLFNPSNDRAKWVAARDANKAVMDLPGFSILSNGTTLDYYNTFNGKDQSEIIFARYFTPTNSQSGNNGINSWFFPNGFDTWSAIVPTQDIIDSYEMSNGKLPSEPGSGYDPQHPYDNREPRFYANFMFNGALFYDPYSAKAVRPLEYYRDKNNPSNTSLNGRESRGASFYADGASASGYNFKKYTVEGLGAYNFGANRQVNPWIYFRKTEFYLNYAECEIALDNEEPARTAINAVRSKTGLLPVTESGNALIARYRRERRVELMVEDHRLHDIRRWKIGPEALDKPAMGVDVYRDGTVMIYEYDYVVDANRRWDDKMYWAPIPFGEIQRSNNKLSQNPGY